MNTASHDSLGLDALTDDQLVELARGIAAEMANRNPSVVDAAKAAIAAATARAVDDQEYIWTVKAWLARIVVSHIGKGWQLNVWRARDRDETRVYLEKGGSGGRGRDAVKYCLYVTGSRNYAPGSLSVEKGRDADEYDSDLIKIVCRHAVEKFMAGVQIDCDYAAALKYLTPPEPHDLQDWLALQSKKAAHRERRKQHMAEIHKTIMMPVREAEAAAVAEAGVEKFSDVSIASEAWRRVSDLRQQLSQQYYAAMAAWDAENKEPK